MNFNPAPFRFWLLNRKYSTSTINNYIADINKFFDYHKNCQLEIENLNDFVSEKAISSYLSSLTDKTNYKRYLASLNKFCQFALDQHIISSNPVAKIRKTNSSKYRQNQQTNSKDIINQFALYLKQQNKSNSTINNYLVYIGQFLDWADNESK